MKANNYYIGQTLQLKGISTPNDVTVTVRKVITRDLLTVSYGFDRTGKDILGVITPSKHVA
jgi:hypothetical protein